MPSIVERLIDSEEHAGEAAVPAVAEEAAQALGQAQTALVAAKALIAEAMASHIYDAANGARPTSDCPFVAGIAAIDQVLFRIGEQSPCDECGADIPALHPSCVNDFHAQSCSLHPANTVGADAATPRPYTVLLMKPDYIADNYGEDTCLMHVSAATPAAAAAEAQARAFALASSGDDEPSGEPDDFAVLLLIAGTHQHALED